MAKNLIIKEKSKKLCVAGQYDVIVVGGGVAGVAAALASARNGAKTLLIEKSYMLGGLATAGLVTVYLPICDGMGRQVSFGIAEELLRLSVKHGVETSWKSVNKTGEAWLQEGSDKSRKEHRFEVQFNASVFAILCEQLLIETGVDILYGTSVVSATVKNKKINAIITENKSGRQAYTAKNFIDASGDADLAFVSGARTVDFKQGNILASWYYYVNNGEFLLKPLGYADIPDKFKTKEEKENRGLRYTGLEGKELSDMMRASHENILADFLKDGPLKEDRALATIATIPQIRMTRRIDGLYTLDDEESFKTFDDSVGMISNWRKAGPVYEVPYACLISKNIKNLSACGRCISATEAMWELSRVIPCCAVTGEAVGTAAALSQDFHSADIRKIQKVLVSNGVKLHTTELPELE